MNNNIDNIIIFIMSMYGIPFVLITMELSFFLKMLLVFYLILYIFRIILITKKTIVDIMNESITD